MIRLSGALLVFAFLGSCLVVPEGARPEATISGVVASEYNFRGMTNVEAPVAQVEAQIDLPTKLETGFVSVRAFANYDLKDDAGDAWFPDGHSGEPSQIDMAASYTETYRGFDFTTGIVSYALQNGDEFPFAAERGETKEVFFHASREVALALVPLLAIHYDFDEVEDWYVNAGVSREFPINEQFVADARISLGYVGEDQADWIYGFPESGLADLQAAGRISYLLDQNTTIHLSVNGSSIIDSTLQDWFDLIGIDENTVWAALGVTWGY